MLSFWQDKRVLATGEGGLLGRNAAEKIKMKNPDFK